MARINTVSLTSPQGQAQPGVADAMRPDTEEADRMRLARILQQQGSAPQPVYSGGQGALMLANAALGGFLENRARAEQKREREGLARETVGFLTQPGGPLAGATPEVQRQAMAAVLANPQMGTAMVQQWMQRRMETPQLTDLYDAQGRQARGFIDPVTRQPVFIGGSKPFDLVPVGPGASLVDQEAARAAAAAAPTGQGAPGAPQAAPGASPAPTTPGAAPQGQGAPLRPGVVFQSPGYRPLTSPDERRAAGISPEDRTPYQIGPDNKISAAGPQQTNVTANVNTAANPLMEGFSKQFVEQRAAATSAAGMVRNLHEARSLLDSGEVIVGIGADRRLDLARLGAFVGITDPRVVANTETFRSQLGNQALDRIKELGSNPSNSDLTFIRQVVGGEIALDEGTFRRLFDIQERAARASIQRYNDTAGRVVEEIGRSPNVDPQGLAITRTLGPVSMPSEYVSPTAPREAPVPMGRPDIPLGNEAAPSQQGQMQQPPTFTLDAIDAELARRAGQTRNPPQPAPQMAPPAPGEVDQFFGRMGGYGVP